MNGGTGAAAPDMLQIQGGKFILFGIDLQNIYLHIKILTLTVLINGINEIYSQSVSHDCNHVTLNTVAGSL